MPGSVEIVTNYNTGEVSLFFSGGAQVGWNGAASGGVTAGLIYNLGNSNQNYAGGFTTVSVSPAVGGGYVSFSSGGIAANPAEPTPGGAKVVGLSATANLLGTPTFGASATNYTNPISLGKYWTLANPTNLALFLLRQGCK